MEVETQIYYLLSFLKFVFNYSLHIILLSAVQHTDQRHSCPSQYDHHKFSIYLSPYVVIIILLAVFPMVYIIPYAMFTMINFIIGSLYFLILFIFFAHPLTPYLSWNHQFFLCMNLLLTLIFTSSFLVIVYVHPHFYIIFKLIQFRIQSRYF